MDKSLKLGRFCILCHTGGADADQRNGKALDAGGHFRKNLLQCGLVHSNIRHFTAAAAIQVAMGGKGVVEMVRVPRNLDPADASGIHQAVQIAVYGAKAQAGANLPQRRINCIGGGVIASGLDLIQDQFTLFGLAHGRIPPLDGG